MKTVNEMAVSLAREALRGFFDDPDGFSKMDSPRQKLAVNRVEKKLWDLDLVEKDGDSEDPLSQRDRADRERWNDQCSDADDYGPETGGDD